MTSPLYRRAQEMLMRGEFLSEDEMRLRGVPEDLIRRAPEIIYDEVEGMTIAELCHYFDAVRQARERGESAKRTR